ncbi:uncharacterized protein PHACADRAFT_213839 [Phanerochaete carnosa HHB-10118-sp]|uniref:Glucose-methanol-choline oxidoreductase N-terminal domain-containing protein n=1 Tax=Phanerochaete carnosa (strain HHB-10118-sp) TaxID=650164 RepID=K5VTF0_PHACS|nr:uncharacterized protein PHACADRAFT_213839 [Phanerochaete carnosa HHB-10118-sp]EKM50075.1 hypothetical protein PHACADRAFT_213839 [Phanerochaete carnosa HHB-10118-sp]
MAEKLARSQDIDGRAFDYIIIGKCLRHFETAGSVLAHRLSEDPNVTVAVLEAGKAHFDDPLINSPLLFSKQFGSPEYDWAFPVVPQENAPQAHLLPWSRGTGLGGSSKMNILAYTKPAREEMDALEALGNPGWNWESYQKYIKKAEGYLRSCRYAHRRSVSVIADSAYLALARSTIASETSITRTPSDTMARPLTVSFVPTGSGADAAFQQSLAKNGLDVLTDALGGEIIGSWKGLSTFDPDSGRRVDAATAYLLPILDRPNLKVLTEAYVCRILTEGEGESVVARGVEFEHGGRTQKAFAAREVILSAGGIKSPQILELSGIGDRKILEPLGIRTAVDLPAVGNNSQEHHLCRAPFLRMKEGKGLITGYMLATDERVAADLKEMHKLDIDYAIVLNALAFAPLQTMTDRAPEMIAKKKAQLAKNWETYPPGLRKQYELMLKLLESVKGADIEYFVSASMFRQPPEPRKPHMGVTPNLTHPWSRGAIHIASADPKAQPRIDPHYFEDEMDLEIMAEGLKYILKVIRTPPFNDLVDLELIPGLAVDVSTDEKLKDFIRKNTSTTWHTCGTCSMMPRGLGGVVDPELRVYGTKNLRVVDLSVLPLMVAVHTQAVVYGIAEQAADIIKKSAQSTSV